jgi:hypothetical protein
LLQGRTHGKDSIAPAPAGAQRKIACATFDVTDFYDDKKSLVFKRKTSFYNCLRIEFRIV